MRRAAKRDANESELVKAAREMGALWVFAPPLDGWIGWKGRFYPVEIKNLLGRNEYTDRQVDFLARAGLKALPVFTWRTIDDVLKSLN